MSQHEPPSRDGSKVKAETPVCIEQRVWELLLELASIGFPLDDLVKWYLDALNLWKRHVDTNQSSDIDSTPTNYSPENTMHSLNHASNTGYSMNHTSLPDVTQPHYFQGTHSLVPTSEHSRPRWTSSAQPIPPNGPLSRSEDSATEPYRASPEDEGAGRQESNGKPPACPWCETPFAETNYRNTHMKTHCGSLTIYICQSSNCHHARSRKKAKEHEDSSRKTSVIPHRHRAAKITYQRAAYGCRDCAQPVTSPQGGVVVQDLISHFRKCAKGGKGSGDRDNHIRGLLRQPKILPQLKQMYPDLSEHKNIDRLSWKHLRDEIHSNYVEQLEFGPRAQNDIEEDCGIPIDKLEDRLKEIIERGKEGSRSAPESRTARTVPHEVLSKDNLPAPVWTNFLSASSSKTPATGLKAADFGDRQNQSSKPSVMHAMGDLNYPISATSWAYPRPTVGIDGTLLKFDHHNNAVPYPMLSHDSASTVPNYNDVSYGDFPSLEHVPMHAFFDQS